MYKKIVAVRLNPSFQSPALMADYANVPSWGGPPGGPASGSVQLGTVANGQFVNSGYGANVAMTQAQYDNWGVNDDYAVNTFIDNYGLTRV